MECPKLEEQLVRKMLIEHMYEIGKHAASRARESGIIDVAGTITELATSGSYSRGLNTKGPVVLLIGKIAEVEYRLVVASHFNSNSKLFVITLYKDTLGLEAGKNWKKFPDRELIYTFNFLAKSA